MMNYSTGRADLSQVQLGLIGMPDDHATLIAEMQVDLYQSLCLCGWISSISFREEVELLRALHIHQIKVFGEPR